MIHARTGLTREQPRRSARRLGARTLASRLPARRPARSARRADAVSRRRFVRTSTPARVPDCSFGARESNRRALRAETTSVNMTTRRSSRTSNAPGTAPGMRNRENRSTLAWATSRLNVPPTTAITRLSVNKLADQAPSARPHGQAHRDLARMSPRAAQHQVHDDGVSEEQHDPSEHVNDGGVDGMSLELPFRRISSPAKRLFPPQRRTQELSGRQPGKGLAADPPVLVIRARENMAFPWRRSWDRSVKNPEAWGTGAGASTRASAELKMAALAPISSASDSIVTGAKPGFGAARATHTGGRPASGAEKHSNDHGRATHLVETTTFPQVPVRGNCPLLGHRVARTRQGGRSGKSVTGRDHPENLRPV